MAHNLLPQNYREYLGLGLEIAVSIAAPIFAGYIADSFFETSPWCTLAGVVIGIGTFIYTVMRISNKLNEGDD